MTEKINGYKFELTDQSTIMPASLYIETVAQWDVIGTGCFMIHFHERQRIPNRWVRFWTKVFFSSKWQLPEDN